MQTNIAHVYANIGQLTCIYTCMHTYIFHSGATFGTACEAESESIWFPYIYIKNPPGHLKGFRDPNPKYNGKRPDSNGILSVSLHKVKRFHSKTVVPFKRQFPIGCKMAMLKHVY